MPDGTAAISLQPKVQPVTLRIDADIPPGSRVRLVRDGEPLKVSHQNNGVSYAP